MTGDSSRVIGEIAEGPGPLATLSCRPLPPLRQTLSVATATDRSFLEVNQPLVASRVRAILLHFSGPQDRPSDPRCRQADPRPGLPRLSEFSAFGWVFIHHRADDLAKRIPVRPPPAGEGEDGRVKNPFSPFLTRSPAEFSALQNRFRKDVFRHPV